MPQYCKLNDVKIRLIGKVRFTCDEKDENKMQESLLTRLIDEAEGEVEYDLSPRYTVPFVTDTDGKFDLLPERPTKNLLRTLVELKSVERVLETDFGRGTVVDADKYAESIKNRYTEILGKLLKYRDGQFWQFSHPPLTGLKLNYMNAEADDGFAGQVLVTGEQFSGDFPARRINDPSQSFWNGDLSSEPVFE